MTGQQQGGGGDAAPSPTAGFAEYPARVPFLPQYRTPQACACGGWSRGLMRDGGAIEWLACGHSVVHTMPRCWLQDAEGRDLREVARR